MLPKPDDVQYKWFVINRLTQVWTFCDACEVVVLAEISALREWVAGSVIFCTYISAILQKIALMFGFLMSKKLHLCQKIAHKLWQKIALMSKKCTYVKKIALMPKCKKITLTRIIHLCQHAAVKHILTSIPKSRI